MMLRRGVAYGLLGLIVGTALLLLGLLWVADEWIEDPALEDLMGEELSFLLQLPSPHEARAPDARMRFYRPSDANSPPLPAELHELAPGLHQEVTIEGETWRVLVREVAPGDVAYLGYELDYVESRERLVFGVAGAAIVMLLLAAAAVRLYLRQLEALVERERAFAAAASHELRTPLAVIHGSAEQLAESGAADARVVGRLRRGMKEVTQQLDALLSLSRTRESPPVQELELAQWLPEASESLLAGEGAGRVRWAGGPARLVAPPGAARTVFGNLLQNALLADPAGEVIVTVAPGRVTVDDRGPGLKPEVLPRVFEPGFRGREGGSGMGLYIARAIADRYGWTLSMHNREGGGARAQWTFG
jgi:signal transduction histidine kinase